MATSNSKDGEKQNNKNNGAPRTFRGPYKKVKLNEIEVQLKEALLDGAARIISKKQADHKGRLPPGFMDTLLGELKKNVVLADATRDTVNNHLKKISKNQNQEAYDASPGASSTAKVQAANSVAKPPKKKNSTPQTAAAGTNQKGGKHNGSTSSREPSNKEPNKGSGPSVPLPKTTLDAASPVGTKGSVPAIETTKDATVAPPDPPENEAAPKESSTPTTTAVATLPAAAAPIIVDDPGDNLNEARLKDPPPNLPHASETTTPGPPHPNNKSKKSEDQQAALQWASKEMIAKAAEAKQRGARLIKGEVENIVMQANAKFNLEGDDKIRKETVRSRARRNNPEGRGRGKMKSRVAVAAAPPLAKDDPPGIGGGCKLKDPPSVAALPTTDGPAGNTNAATLKDPPREDLKDPKRKNGPDPTRPDEEDDANAAKRKRSENHEAALVWASKEILARTKEAKQRGTRLNQGVSANIVMQANAKFNLEGKEKISAGTVRSRVQRNNPDGRMKSPMDDVEPALVDACNKCARMNEPLSSECFLELAHKLIEGTPIEEKRKRLAAIQGHDPERTKLSLRYHLSFLKRNGEKLSDVRALRNNFFRQQWATHQNVEKMYDRVSEYLVEVGIARKLDSPVYRSKSGKIVNRPDQAFGFPCKFKLLHPERLLHMDVSDSSRGINMYTAQKEGKATVTADILFTVSPIRNALGEPVLAVVVLQSESTEIPEDWKLGIDIAADLLGGADMAGVEVVRRNPSGPSCVVGGKEVPCFMDVSPHGGITSQVLANVLAYLDKLDVFPRDQGPLPCMILDGHNERFGVPFVRYVLDKQHEWHAFKGVPYGSHLAVVGDASEMNKAFKRALETAKKELLQLKQLLRMDTSLLPTDVIPLVNKVWSQSFGDVSMARKALSERGWNPMNRALLRDKDIVNSLLKDTGKVVRRHPRRTDDGSIVYLKD
ncbi:expressed unknown protein [Seminavis robusta]|uniref:Uncharacterized protein n=1 Tax=Seminavis robusta TaxID=568900 RepID=A0A9N8EHU0_9STRA|nr:expressed unknown protein [Seminavis robusta]|eukprot:Sro1102_g241510.1 n/a (945) ;mRNA; f:933-3828